MLFVSIQIFARIFSFASRPLSEVEPPKKAGVGDFSAGNTTVIQFVKTLRKDSRNLYISPL